MKVAFRRMPAPYNRRSISDICRGGWEIVILSRAYRQTEQPTLSLIETSCLPWKKELGPEIIKYENGLA